MRNKIARTAALSNTGQYIVELFYKFQFSQDLAITPGPQLIIDPALNLEENTIWVFELRAWLALCKWFKYRHDYDKINNHKFGKAI
jgi:hypothetical protein